ncbi:MAG: peptide chain release factor N(5)-glutamine methyltransferase [Anaerolineae bacterium]|nr:peptide chain release factor N(5)-glutamine methyltransferase [Anaerolineae bacterium]
MTVLRVDEALAWAEQQLGAVSESDTSARLLLAHVLGRSVTDLFVHPEWALTGPQQAEFERLVARRADYEPVAYLIGHRAFFDLDLAVDVRVLIPRQETELLVECALDLARCWPQSRVADVGTGSGAIAVSLAVHLPRATIWAVDRSAEALEVARANARRCGVEGQIAFLQGDMLSPLPGQVDLIAANLPYVSESEYADLPPDVRRYEPCQALLAGVDGLAAIRALLRQAPEYLAPDGIILLEIGAGQGAAVAALARNTFPQARIEAMQDYAHLDRIIIIDLGMCYDRQTHSL